VAPPWLRVQPDVLRWALSDVGLWARCPPGPFIPRRGDLCPRRRSLRDQVTALADVSRTHRRARTAGSQRGRAPQPGIDGVRGLQLHSIARRSARLAISPGPAQYLRCGALAGASTWRPTGPEVRTCGPKNTPLPGECGNQAAGPSVCGMAPSTVDTTCHSRTGGRVRLHHRDAGVHLRFPYVYNAKLRHGWVTQARDPAVVLYAASTISGWSSPRMTGPSRSPRTTWGTPRPGRRRIQQQQALKYVTANRRQPAPARSSRRCSRRHRPRGATPGTAPADP
jgi:hypothetical protein